MATANLDTRFFGHPRGLATLFFTEMWERFSYYGMRALLLLYMISPTGLQFDKGKGAAVYGMVVSLVYLMSIPGGWLADRFLGQRKAVIYGGIGIAAGNFCLAAPSVEMFYVGLTLVSLGTGLLKPNVSTLVGSLYEPGDNRRDAGFSIYYMGINIGAFFAPLVCGYVGQMIEWRLAFLVVGAGMTLGLIQFLLGSKHLGQAGLHAAPFSSPAEAATQKRYLWGGLAVLLGVPLLIGSGVIAATVTQLADALGVLLMAVIGVVFAGVYFGPWTPAERKRILVIFVLFLVAAIFWSSFEQAGSTLNLFADEKTDNQLLGLPFPSTWFQSLNSIFLIALAPLFGWLWIQLGPKEPSVPAKFVLGLVFVGAGFVALMPAAAVAASGAKVSPLWLTGTYLLHTIGELCLSPVGLSAMTKLAPAKVVGVIMGVWFLAASVGNYIGGRLAGFYESMPLDTLFGYVGAFAIAAGLLLALFIKPLRTMMGGIK
jgi:POT family proton-dependent oligopeptide transporter